MIGQQQRTCHLTSSEGCPAAAAVLYGAWPAGLALPWFCAQYHVGSIIGIAPWACVSNRTALMTMLPLFCWALRYPHIN